MEFLNTNKTIQDIYEYYETNQFLINGILAFLTSFILTFTAIPKIIRVSYKKHLMDIPGERSSHQNRIPNLGGLGIYYGLCIGATIFANQLFNQYIFLFACLVILLFVGLMDDILVVSPRVKLSAQLVVALMIIVGSDVRIGNFFGAAGLEKIPFLLSVIFTILVFIILINAYNLIDGIDGLAASIGIVSTVGFAYSFYRLGSYEMVILSVSLVACLLAFLNYNLSKRHKIIMGDTGSMIVGFLLTFMAIKLLNLLMLETVSGQLYYHLPSAPAIVVAFLIIPIVDTLSVAAIRIKNGASPLRPDKNHIHHRFLALGLNHKTVTIIIVIFNILLIILTYFLRRLNVNILGMIVIGTGLGFSILPYLIEHFQKKNE